MDGEMNYKSYYKECLQKGLEFQDFVSSLLLKELGLPLTAFNSKKYQYSLGENAQGIEIKFDDKYKATGNIYIETHEKADPERDNYTESGIYRNDNSWLYLIGNYSEVFIFSKKILHLLDSANQDRKQFKQVQTKTSIGFLLPKSDAEKYCAKKITI